MKTAKIINLIFWAVVAVLLNIGVYVEWSANECEPKSIVLGCILFTSFCLCFWYCINNHLREREKSLF